MVELTKDDNNWIATQTAEFDREPGEVEAMYTKVHTELTDAKLNEAIPAEEFIAVLRGGVLGKLQAEVTAPPTEFESMIIGHYAPKNRKGNLICDMVAMMALPGGVPEMAIATAWNTDCENRKQYGKLAAVKTGFTYFANDKTDGRYNVTVQRKTDMLAESDITWVPGDYNDRLKMLQENVPLITLGEAASKTSRIISSGDWQFPDILDLRRVRVNVVDYKDGAKADGLEWGRYSLIDMTFKGNEKKRSFTGWVDPVIARRAGAGPGSYIEAYGIVTTNMGDGSPEMNVCFVHPLMVKPMESATSQIQKDAPVVSAENMQTPAIKIMQDSGM